MSRAFAKHDPDAILDYAFDWSDWLAEGESISQSTWTGPTGVTLTPLLSGSLAVVTVEVTDEALTGQLVSLVNHVVASDDQEDDRTLKLLIAQR